MKPSMQLVIGNKNYSSWSLRPWLAMAVIGLEFEEVIIPLQRPNTAARILEYTPSARVPCLIDAVGETKRAIWDSLAICEYVNEEHTGGRLWPRDVQVRAMARSISAEMHSGFAALRTHLPMDIRKRDPERGAQAMEKADVARDVARVQAIWSAALAASQGPFLFGDFSIADAFYAPVVTRFATYRIAMAPELSAYSARIFALPAMQRWVDAAGLEAEVLAQ